MIRIKSEQAAIIQGLELKPKAGPTVYRKLSPAKTSEVYDTFWKFATKRQEVFFNRIRGESSLGPSDPIISRYKFTNVYRAADRVSQYLIKNVIYNLDLSTSPEETLFRILLFKLFNKIETWELLTSKFGHLTWEDYSFRHYNKILTNEITNNRSIYSGAYIMPSGSSYFGFQRKHANHLKLIELIIQEETQKRLASAKKMQDAFEILKAFPSLGDFLSYQLLIDINYSEILNFSESEFVVAGPGAKGGISKCFHDTGGLSNVEIIKLVTDRQELEFERLGLTFETLWGRRLQLIDCQNIFCEVDKYSRVKHPLIRGSSNRIKIKQIFRASPHRIHFWFPPKWQLNDKISSAV